MNDEKVAGGRQPRGATRRGFLGSAVALGGAALVAPALSARNASAASPLTLDVQYRNLAAYRAGRLPADRASIDAFHSELVAQIADAKRRKGGSPAVERMRALIAADPVVRMLVTQMIEQVPVPNRTIMSVNQMLDALTIITQSAPAYIADKSKQRFFPMSALFVYMMMTAAGYAAFRNEAFNAAIKDVLLEWCTYLDSPASTEVLNTGDTGWLSPSAYTQYKLQDFVIPDPNAPHWGWASFNDFFHREIKPEKRPIAAPGDPSVVVAANDGTVYKIADVTTPQDQFWIKGQPYSLVDMLDTNAKAPRYYVGGTVFQSFLSGADYHRWHAPISGTVKSVRIVPGLYFSEAESAGYDPDAGVLSQGYGSAVNTRGLIEIESPYKSIGCVMVMPIGITEISSVRVTVSAGDVVQKGQELGWFSYGGSSMCVLFKSGAIHNYVVNVPDRANVNSQIAVAKLA